MERKILSLDCDGTLLTTDKKVSVNVKDALHRILDEGHIVAFNTGRSIVGVKNLFSEYSLDREGVFFLCFNGCIIYDPWKEEVLYRKPLDNEKALELFRDLKDAGIYAHTYNDHEILTFVESKEFEMYNSVTHEKYKVLDSLDELKDVDIPKIICIDYDDVQKLHDFQDSYREKEKGVFNSFFSCPYFLEYCDASTNKGASLKALANILNIDMKNTVAVGDEENDISQVEVAGVGYAMKNAVDELKAVADRITLYDNDHDGVLEIIEDNFYED